MLEPGLAPTSLSAVCPTHADESCAMLAQAVAHEHSSGEVKALIALYRVTDNIFTRHPCNSIFVQDIISVTVDRYVEDYAYWTNP